VSIFYCTNPRKFFFGRPSCGTRKIGQVVVVVVVVVAAAVATATAAAVYLKL